MKKIVEMLVLTKNVLLGPWWWSRGQRPCLLLRQSEFESCWLLKFSVQNDKNKWKRGRGWPPSFKISKLRLEYSKHGKQSEYKWEKISIFTTTAKTTFTQFQEFRGQLPRHVFIENKFVSVLEITEQSHLILICWCFLRHCLPAQLLFKLLKNIHVMN